MEAKENNKSYEYIVQYIRTNRKILSANELRFLLLYAATLKRQGIENSGEITVENITSDLKILNDKIKTGNLTSIAFTRFEKVLDLFNRLLSGEDLNDISYEIDKLYLENDMYVRPTSTLVKKLQSVSKENQRGLKR